MVFWTSILTRVPIFKEPAWFFGSLQFKAVLLKIGLTEEALSKRKILVKIVVPKSRLPRPVGTRFRPFSSYSLSALKRAPAQQLVVVYRHSAADAQTGTKTEY